MRDLSYENEFCMQFHFHANLVNINNRYCFAYSSFVYSDASHFHKWNGFALRLALKQRHKLGTRKWPVIKLNRSFKI